jgi:hypothetical protein
MQAVKTLTLGLLCLCLLTAICSVRAHDNDAIPWKSKSAETSWKVQDGTITFYFYEEALRSSGISITDLHETGGMDQPGRMKIEPPWCDVRGDRAGRSNQLDLTLLNSSSYRNGISFDITEESDFTFRVYNGVLDPAGLVKGNIRFDGGLTFELEESAWDMQDFILEYVHDPGESSVDEPMSHSFRLRNGAEGSPFIMDAKRPMTVFMDAYNMLILGYCDLEIRGEWARAMGRPELEGRMVGVAEVQATSIPLSPGSYGDVTFTPRFYKSREDTLDCLLGFLMRFQQYAHVGTYPDGIAALTMLTLSCNVGNVDIPWEAPMDEDHPGIPMQIYRETDHGSYTTFEMIGYSDIKHGFFALSNSDCDPCEHPSDGTFLGVGCSDAYGQGNNADPTWLAPRHEWDPYIGRWECLYSHFAGEEPDCVRRHGGGGHDQLEHRLFAYDSDLETPNSTYYYECMYVVENDINKMNNLGYRKVSIVWDGLGWDCEDLDELILGPALLQWDADLHTWAQVGTDDGHVLMSSKATDMGGGTYHYEYALLNFDSHRRVRSIAIPVDQAGTVTNTDFHFPDVDDPNYSWDLIQTDQYVTYETVTFEEDTTAALMYMTMLNFRFDADAPPRPAFANLGVFRPGDPMEITALVMAPSAATSVEDVVTAGPPAVLHPSRPNPLSPPTLIHFEVGMTTPVRLDIYNAAGRRIRTLVDRVMTPGSHNLVWDGTGSTGRRVSSGVYYYLLKVGDDTAKRTVVVVD